MPKGFSEREKEIIRASLLEKGRALVAAHGMKRTSVEDLTSAVGISKGAFYLFFNSKEELFFELLEQFEAEFKANLLKDVAQPGSTPRQRFKALLRQALTAWKANPLFAHFGRQEYEYLLRKLPEERMRAHVHKDDLFALEPIAEGRQANVLTQRDPKLVANLIKGLFFLSLHADDFGPDVYPDVIDIFVDLVAGYLVEE
jgi:AcrR family transcriptional regulator